jgi:O-antigen/teichoic acid export membrane protein
MRRMLASHLKNLARQSAVYGMADGFGPLLTLLLLPILTRVLTPEEMGALGLLQLFAVATKIFFRMGLDAGFFRIYYDQASDAERRVFCTTVLAAGGLLSLVLFALSVALSGVIGDLLVEAPAAKWITLVAADTFLNTFSYIPMSLFRIEGRAHAFLAATILRNALNAGLKVGLVLAGWGVDGVLWSDVLSSAVFIAALAPTLVGHLGWGFDVSRLRAAAAFGLPKVPHGIAYQALNLADRRILLFYASRAEVGLYHVAYQFGTGIKLFLSAFELAWAPFVYERAGREDAPLTLARIATYVTLGLAALGLAIAVFAREILALFTAPEYHAAYPVVPVVMLAYLIQGLFAVSSIGIGISKKAYYYPLMTFVAATSNIGLNLALIPWLGILGAAWATVAGYAVMAVLGVIFSQKHYPIPFEWGRLGRILAAAAVLYLSVALGAPPDLFPGIAFKAVGLAAFPIVLAMLGFFRPAEWVRLKAFFRRAAQERPVAPSDLDAPLEQADGRGDHVVHRD